jgi:hypothetical protein
MLPLYTHPMTRNTPTRIQANNSKNIAVKAPPKVKLLSSPPAHVETLVPKELREKSLTLCRSAIAIQRAKNMHIGTRRLNDELHSTFGIFGDKSQMIEQIRKAIRRDLVKASEEERVQLRKQLRECLAQIATYKR